MHKLEHTPDSLIKHLPFSYYSLPLYLDCFGYTFKRNQENLIVTQDLVFPHEFPSLFLPTHSHNWQHCSITFATESDKEKIAAEGIVIGVQHPVGTEFFYQTDAFMSPTGSFGKKVRAFQNNYTYKLSSSYSREGIESFHARWLATQTDRSMTFDSGEQFYQFCLDHQADYPIKQVYVEIDGTLCGFAWGIEHPQGGWVGLHLKVDYTYQGLSRFLHHQRAKLFQPGSEFTLGSGVFDQGIEAYKRELHPSREVSYFYLLTQTKEPTG